MVGVSDGLDRNNVAMFVAYVEGSSGEDLRIMHTLFPMKVLKPHFVDRILARLK